LAVRPFRPVFLFTSQPGSLADSVAIRVVHHCFAIPRRVGGPPFHFRPGEIVPAERPLCTKTRGKEIVLLAPASARLAANAKAPRGVNLGGLA
jgi:hypothetical protein